jgi:hypothetical protein
MCACTKILGGKWNHSGMMSIIFKVYGELYHDIKYIKKQHEHFIGIVMYICTQIHSGFMAELVCAPMPDINVEL